MPAGTRNTRIPTFLIFLFSIVTGIGMFIAAWNSYLNGKGKIYLSLGLLFLFIIGMLGLFFRIFSQNTSGKNISLSEALNSADANAVAENPTVEITKEREETSNLLKGVFTRNDLKSIGEKLLKNLSKEFEIVQGVVFVLNSESAKFTVAASYALSFDSSPQDFAPGEGITGQAVSDSKIMIIPNLPESFTPVISGLGKAKARYLYVIPLIHERKSLAVVEISCFKEIEEGRMSLLNQLMREGGLKLSTILSPGIR